MTKLKSRVKAKQRKQKILKEKQKYDKYIKDLRSKILLFDDPILKQVSEAVEFSWLKESTGENLGLKKEYEELGLKKEFENNIKLLRKVLAVSPNGVGLAACQIGILKRIIAIRPDIKNKEISILINPEIIEFGEEKEVKMEGCLSYPNIYAPIPRSKKIKVRYVDENNKEYIEEFKDFKARVVIHEVEHTQSVCKIGDAWRVKKQQQQEEEAKIQQ